MGLSQAKLLESGHVFFSVECDLTRRMQKQYSSNSNTCSGDASFWWNYRLCEYLGSAYSGWCLKTIYGFVETTELQLICHEHANNALEDWKANNPSEPFRMTLISRRSRKRAGLRYITRGIDRRGDVANFVETEQIIWKSNCEKNNCSFSSFVIIRGSVPVFWRQNKGSVKPPPELDAPLDLCRSSFRKHFQNLIRSYGSLIALSLVDQNGTEAILAASYARHFELDMDELCSELTSQSLSPFYRPQLCSFDFHYHCSGTDWEHGIQTLLSQVKSFASRQKFFVLHSQDGGNCTVRSLQDGVFRVNCVDCLDRTNVAQSAIARHLLIPQAKAVYIAGMQWNKTSQVGPRRLETTSESAFNKIWSNNADILSKQYAVSIYPLKYYGYIKCD